MDQYHISDLPQRFIMAQHYQSSLDQPNLENVQAKLNVARQRNHDLAMQYFRNKYGSTLAYEQFAKHHNLGEFKPVHKLTSQYQILDGYDSDPQVYQSKALAKNSLRKGGRSAKKIQNSTSFVEETKGKSSYKNQTKVTIPIPFSFDEREKQKQKNKVSTIVQQRTQSKVFKAKPIPAKVLDNGLYNRMIEEDRKKIEERKKKSMLMTLANERPFSFMNRKTNKKTKEERQNFVFTANPIPWYCSVNLLEKKKQAEIIRNEKIAKEAQQNLARAKLPPRMERDFQQKQAQLALAAEQQKNKKAQSKPKVYRQPPDFEKLHREFEEGLERKRKENKVTKPKEFNFTEKAFSRPKTAMPSYQTNQFGQSKAKGMDYKKHLESKPNALSTAKFEQQVEKRRQEMEKKRQQEQKKRIQEENRQKIDENLKTKLLEATKLKEDKQKEQRQAREKEMKQQMKSFQQWKKNCIQKGRQQPMLIQRSLKRDERIQKMKKLYQISQTLKNNGIKGKDHDSYFKRQQLLMIQDWEQLKDRLT